MHNTYVLNLAHDLWGKKWRTSILYALRDGPKRFSEIKTHVPDCSVKVLSEALKELENNKLIIREVNTGIPIKVIYTLHPDLVPMMELKHHYNKFLAEFFLKYPDRFILPKEIVEKLQQDMVTE